MLHDTLGALHSFATARSFEELAEASREPYEGGEELPWWADNLGHFLSGGGVALIPTVLGGVTVALIAYTVAAIVWEMFEYKYEVRPWDPADDWAFDRAVEDTICDFVMGAAGAYTVAYLVTLV